MNDDSRPISLPPFPSEYRASGVLVHITSLPSRYGIGEMGPGAQAWIDRLHEAGRSWWQALPFGPTGYGDLPYQVLSSFAGNGLLSLDWLIEDGLLRESDCERCSFPALLLSSNTGCLKRCQLPRASGSEGGRCTQDMLLGPVLDWLRDLTQTGHRPGILGRRWEDRMMEAHQ